MTGIYLTFKDGAQARVDEFRILDTYAGQLAGTLTVGTLHKLPAIKGMMQDLKEGKAMGYYYPEPELVDEAQLRGFSEHDIKSVRSRTKLDKCLKEQHLVATLHISDPDYCHIIKLHWFQTGKELAETPLVALIQNMVGQLTFEELYPYCEHEDWLDMY